MDGPACLFDEKGQLKTDRQMAAARAEQSEQRERDECEFLHRTLNAILKKPRRPAWVSPGLPLCPGRQTDPAQHKRSGELVSERFSADGARRSTSSSRARRMIDGPGRPEATGVHQFLALGQIKRHKIPSNRWFHTANSDCDRI